MFTERYLIKIDPTKPGSNDNYIEMNAFEFVELKKLNPKREFHFAKVYADPDVDHDIYYKVECTPEEEAAYKKKDNNANYLDIWEDASGYTHISYNDIGDDHLNGEEILEDPNTNVEAIAINNIQKAELRAAIHELPQRQRAVMILLYYSGSERVTEQSVADYLGITYEAVHSLHKQARRRLKKKLNPQK